MSDSPATTAVLDIAQLRQAEDTAAWVLEEAKRQGADGAEVNVSLSQGYSVNVRQGEVETVEFHRDRGVSVTLFCGQRKGHASSSDDNRDSLRDTIQAAASIARYTEEDRYAGLAPASMLAREVPDLDLYHPWAMDTQAAIDEALRCETIARNDERIVNSEGASINSVSPACGSLPPRKVFCTATVVPIIAGSAAWWRKTMMACSVITGTTEAASVSGWPAPKRLAKRPARERWHGWGRAFRRPVNCR